jgi:hypothetical protein
MWLMQAMRHRTVLVPHRSTADNTLRRKSSICAGDPNGLDVFDPAVAWDGFATDTFWPASSGRCPRARCACWRWPTPPPRTAWSERSAYGPRRPRESPLFRLVLFDEFHVLRQLGEALDTVRKSEYGRLSGKDRRFIKGQEYTLLSSRETLTMEGRKSLALLIWVRRRTCGAPVSRSLRSTADLPAPYVSRWLRWIRFALGSIMGYGRDAETRGGGR